MFTGLIEEIGTLRSMEQANASARLAIQASQVLEHTQIGHSIAVNGVCLTVSALSPGLFFADAVHETLNRSTLGQLRPGDPVNLERAMAADGRFGGHLVAGHVDGTGTVSQIRRDGRALWFTIQAPPSILRYVVEKGSIAVDGISLTIAQALPGRFLVSVIPHTAAATTLSRLRPGSRVNLETDLVGKYVEKLLGSSPFSPQDINAQSKKKEEFLYDCLSFH